MLSYAGPSAPVPLVSFRHWVIATVVSFFSFPVLLGCVMALSWMADSRGDHGRWHWTRLVIEVLLLPVEVVHRLMRYAGLDAAMSGVVRFFTYVSVNAVVWGLAIALCVGIIRRRRRGNV